MQFDLTQEQEMIVDMTRKFVQNEIIPYEDEVEKTNEVSDELKQQIRSRAIETGLYSANMPEEFGGGGIDDLTELWDCNKPIVCAVNGYAGGGGFEFALASDIIIASDNARFFLPEPWVGVIADSGGVLRLQRKIPYNIAMDMLLTGRQMDAQEALKWGLVNQVVKLSDLRDIALAKAKEILGVAPLAIQSIKAIVRECECLSIQDGFKKMRSGDIEVYKKMLYSDDAKEGPLAFVEKRKPNWKGK